MPTYWSATVNLTSNDRALEIIDRVQETVV